VTGTLLTTLEVAERLGLSSAAVAQAVRTGALQPTARTNEDFLFTERAIAAFAESRAEAAAVPLEPPPAVSRAEWSGDLDRLNSWLRDLSESAPAPAPPPAPPAPPPMPIATPDEARTAIDFQPPPHHPAEAPASEPAPEPAAVVAAEPEAVEEPHLPTPAEATAPLPEAVAALKSGLSRQAVLVVEPIERFRVLRDIADRLGAIPGVDDARLERLEGGLASYRLSFGSNRPSGEAIAGALAPLGLQVMLVDAE
jgi:hypothetical protein